MSVHHPHTAADYDALKAKSGLVVIDFSATWCGPCRMIAPYYEELAAANPDVTFVHVDIDELKGMPDLQGVRGVPTFKFFVNGELKHEFSGASKDSLLNAVNQYKA